MSPTPTRVKVLGVLMLVVAVPNAISPLDESVSYGRTPADLAWQVGLGAALGVVGAGLLYDATWAWGVSLVVGVALVLGGALVITGPGDIAHPDGAVVGGFLASVGVVALGILLSPRSLRWLMAARRRSA
jgi:hypothetical protein